MNKKRKSDCIMDYNYSCSFILAFSIVLKEPIIAIIDGYYDKLNLMVLNLKVKPHNYFGDAGVYPISLILPSSSVWFPLVNFKG